MYTYIYMSIYTYLCYKWVLKNLKLIVTVLEDDTTVLQRILLVVYHLLKKTGEEVKLLIGRCSICKRKKSMVVSDNVIRAESLGDFFKNLVKRTTCIEKMAKNVLSNPGRALDLTAKIATAAVSKNSKQALPTIPELITCYNTGKGL